MTKHKRLFTAAAAATALLAAVLFATSAANAESNGGVRVMPLGDSITDGFNVPGGYRIGLWQRSWPAGYTVDFVGSGFNGPASLGDHDHEGHSGWRIDQIDANIVNWLRTTTPRTILLHIGTNDMIQNPTNAPARLATLIDRIIAPGTQRGTVRRDDHPAVRARTPGSEPSTPGDQRRAGSGPTPAGACTWSTCTTR